MPSDFSTLNASIDALATEATSTEGIVASTIVVLNGQAAAITKAVTDALAADDAADSGSIKAATDAITAVNARFTAAATSLSNAVATNPTP